MRSATYAVMAVIFALIVLVAIKTARPAEIPIAKPFTKGDTIVFLRVDRSYLDRCMRRFGEDAFVGCFADAIDPKGSRIER